MKYLLEWEVGEARGTLSEVIKEYHYGWMMALTQVIDEETEANELELIDETLKFMGELSRIVATNDLSELNESEAIEVLKEYDKLIYDEWDRHAVSTSLYRIGGEDIEPFNASNVKYIELR